jgi:hypothetical protein
LAQKLDRKELKKPDEFQVVAGKAMGWMVAHQKPVLAVLVVLAVALLGGWAASAYSSSRDVKAGAERSSVRRGRWPRKRRDSPAWKPSRAKRSGRRPSSPRWRRCTPIFPAPRPPRPQKRRSDSSS